MNKILLIRHAQAAGQGIEPGDHPRPLSAKGRAQADALGILMQSQNWIPDLALVSTALRTQETWKALAAQFPGAHMSPCENLYLASPQTIIKEINAAPDISTLAIVAHNPGLAILAGQWIEQGAGHDQQAAQILQTRFKPAFAAAFDFSTGLPRLVHLFDPRECG